jgi:pimeloyl-ACP methyl ester carboxylesterase
MGGNVAMSYAGVRPERIRRLVNLEGFGLPETHADRAPARLAAWLDELRQPPTLRAYDSVSGVAARLRMNNPRLPQD